MELFDIVLIIIIAGFAMFGFWFGLVHTVGSLAGTVLGVYLASRYFQPLADILVHITGWSNNASRIIMFVVAFVIINRLVGFAFWTIEKTFDVVKRLPFITSLNRLLGVMFGLFEGIITVGIVFYFVQLFPLSEGVTNTIANSSVAAFTVSVAAVLIPLIPEGLQLVETGVDNVEGAILAE